MNKREYIQANKEWLAAKAQEEGVLPLDGGIYYKVIAKGRDDGKHPSPRSVITAHYTGWTINGKKFDRGLDYRYAADVRGRPLGGVSACREGLWQVFATGHPWR